MTDVGVGGGDGGPSLRWSDRTGFAYVDGEVLAGTEAARRAVTNRTDRVPVDEAGEWSRFAGVADTLAVVEALQARDLAVQPNHVFFAHGCGDPCPPHPGLLADPAAAGGWSNPLRSNPLRSNPLRSNPLRSNPLRSNHPMESTAVPAVGRELPVRALAGPGANPRITVLDTGVATAPNPTAVSFTPPLLQLAANIRGDLDVPDASVPPDNYLDPVAGHGTFIAGLIEQLAPGCPVAVRKVVSPLGWVTEWELAGALTAVFLATPRPDIVNLSLGGPALAQPQLLRQAVADLVAAGVVVVASAGNDGTCVPAYPAAFPGVIAVAALGPEGPALWSNYGDWVDACAPGTDLVSSFFTGWDGQFPEINGADPDEFHGWAVWSGTSFAAPVVVAALAREMVTGGCSASEAVNRLIKAPHLLRLACFGTVVNL
jgi:hypothetical protein